MKQSTRHFYVLNNLLICGKCGSKMTGRSFGSAHRKYYSCTKKRYGEESCNSNLIKVTELDELIWNTLFTDDNLYKEVKRTYIGGDNSEEKLFIDIKDFTKEKEKYEKKLLRTKDMILEDIYDLKEGKAKTLEIESSITGVNSKIAEAEARMENIESERFLLYCYKEDLDKIKISADLVEFILKIRSPEEEEELQDIRDEIAYQDMLAEKEPFKMDFNKEEAINSIDNAGTKDFNKGLIGKDAKEKSRIIKKYVGAIVVNSIRKKRFNITIKFKLAIRDKSMILSQ